MQEEIWKSITGYDGLYEVSNLGRIKSLKRIVYAYNGHCYCKKVHKEKILSPRKTGCMFSVFLTDEKGIGRSFYISNLVALEFIPNPNKLPEVLHLNSTYNDSVSNLKWGSPLDRMPQIFKYRKFKNIKCIETGEIFENAKVITKLKGFCSSTILKCCKKYKYFKTAYGYHWEYVE